MKLFIEQLSDSYIFVLHHCRYFKMENEGQDILRYDVCDKPDYPFHCDICQVNLCRGCFGDHLLDLNRRHQIVPFEERGGLIYSICQTHS